MDIPTAHMLSFKISFSNKKKKKKEKKSKAPQRYV